VDPGKAMNLATNVKHHQRLGIENRCAAHWLIIKPRYFKKALDWIYEEDGKKHGLQTVEGAVSLEMMRACAQFLNQQATLDNTTAAWVVTQGHGTIIKIPIGYAHVVTNGGPCFKVAMDYIPTGHFYQCMISHLFVGRKLNKKLTNDYLSITSHVFCAVHKLLDNTDSLPFGLKARKPSKLKNK
jgi:hypothetical protein